MIAPVAAADVIAAPVVMVEIVRLVPKVEIQTSFRRF
jgi:hypothetical protein